MQDAQPDNKVLSVIERRPSNITGFAWWAVLTYKDRSGHEHTFDELLDIAWQSWDQPSIDIYMAGVWERLRERLKPVILAEDEPKLRLVKD